MVKFTTIQITIQTRLKLKQILKKSETYEEGLCRMIKDWRNNN